MTLRVTSVAENSFNSVERVEEYSHLPQEAALESEQEGGKAPEGWPQEGVVEFKDVRMRWVSGFWWDEDSGARGYQAKVSGMSNI